MIAHLRGTLLGKSPGRAVIDCGGVGYEAAITVPTYAELPAQEEPVSLHIHTHVREDAILLFGFGTLAEKRLFERLISVSGIGPKLALTILSGLEAERLVSAIRSGDHAMLTRIPGVGKKTAERVTLELKDKLEGWATAPAAPESTASAGATGDDVASAMENLGYPRAAAEKAIGKVLADSPETSWEFEALFRAAIAAVR